MSNFSTRLEHERGTYAPMDYTWERERDPGLFSLPSKRQHIETVDGHSTWAPAPFISSTPLNAPYLFDTGSSAMQVDEPSPSKVQQELVDVEMRDSPHRDLPSMADLGTSVPIPSAQESIASSSKSEPLGQGVGRVMNTNAVKKVQKARQRDARGKENGEVVLRGSVTVDEDDEQDDDVTPTTIRRRPHSSRPATLEPQHPPSNNSYTLNMFGHPEQKAAEKRDVPIRAGISHSEMPYIALGYVQFVFNASVVCLCIYLVGVFVWTIRQDVKERMTAYTSELLQEIVTCSNLYLLNRCEPATRIPAMESQCTDWEQCMNRDPTVIGHARVGAEMFAGVITAFVDELSFKTIFFILCSLTCLVFIANSALFSMRARHVQEYHPGYPYPPMDPRIHNHQFQWPPVGGPVPVGEKDARLRDSMSRGQQGKTSRKGMFGFLR